MKKLLSSPAVESIDVNGTVVADPANPLDSAALTGPVTVSTPVPVPQTPEGGLAAVAVAGVQQTVHGELQRTALAAQACESEVNVSQMPLSTAASLAGEFRLDDNDDEVEEDLAEVLVQIDQATSVVEALEELAQALPADEVELDSRSTQLLCVATESLCSQVGLALEWDGEDEDNPFSRYYQAKPQQPTRAAKLSGIIKENAQKIWRAIIDALKKSWKSLKSYAMRYIDQSLNAEKRATALIKKIGTLPLDKRKKDTIDNARLGHALRVRNVWPEHIDRAALTTSMVLQHQIERAYTQGLYDEAILTKLSSGSSEFNYDPQQVRHDSFLSVKSHDLDDGETWSTEHMLGDHVLAQQLPKQPVHEFEALKWMLSTPKLQQTGEGYVDRPIPVATPTQMLVCVKAAQQLARTVNDFRDTLEHLEQLATKLVHAAEGALVDVKKTGEPTGMLQLKLKYQRQYLAQAPRWLVAEPVRVANYSVRVLVALLTYVEKSIACYEPEPQAA